MGFLEQQGNKLREEQFMANQLANYERGLAAEAERQAAVRQGLSYEDAANSNSMLNGLAQSVAYDKFVKNDAPLEDVSVEMFSPVAGSIANKIGGAANNIGSRGLARTVVPVGDLKEVFTNDIITITPEQFANSGAVSPEVKNRAQQTLKEYAKWQQGYK